MTRSLHLTAFEHEVLRVGDDEHSQLSRREAQSLAALAGLRRGFCTRGHNSVKLAQYAGLVNLGGRVLEILPKVGAVADEGTCRGTLLRLLRIANELPLFSRGSASHEVAQGSLLDLFIAAFLDAAMQLVRAGLLQRYREEEADIGVVRGRLLLKRQVSTLAMRPDRLACRYDDLSIDNPRNRIVKAALLAVKRWVQTLESHRKWLELNAAFEEVVREPDPLALLSTLIEDRQASHYRSALGWASLILRLLTPNVRGGANHAPEILFDMNRLFEVAIANLLRRRAKLQGVTVSAQDTGHHLAVFGEDRYFRLVPDIAIYRGENVLSVADTKWSEVQVDSAGRLIPADSHVYQLNAYASVYPCNEFALIYPWHSGLDAARPTSYELRSLPGGCKRLHMVCIDVGAEGLPLISADPDMQLARLLI